MVEFLRKKTVLISCFCEPGDTQIDKTAVNARVVDVALSALMIALNLLKSLHSTIVVSYELYYRKSSGTLWNIIMW